MIYPVTIEEVRKGMFSLGDDKTLGLDGYSTKFFKETWDIVGSDVSSVVIDFFRVCRMPREVNSTIIALVPKKDVPSSVADFRPISCYNMIYKCICKIIANRIKDSLDDVVDQTQSTFIPRRRISDNILLTQEVFCNYHKDVGAT